MTGQIPPKTRYVLRAFGGGVYRGPQYLKIPQTYGGTIHNQTTVTPGVGTVTITGYLATRFADIPSSDRHITQVHTVRVIQGSGVHRRAVYRQVRRVLSLTTAATSTGIGVGTVTIEGYQPTVDIVTGEATRPGVGTVTVTGYRPVVVRQNLFYTGIWQDYLKRVSVGSGVHRRSEYRKYRRFLYFRTYPVDRRIEVGPGSVTILGYQAFLEPNFRYTQAGAVTLQGYPPSILADDLPVNSLTDPVFLAIKASLARRSLVAKHAEHYPRPRDVDRLLITFRRPNPQRILGLAPSTITVTGNQITVQKRVPAAVGSVSVEGYQPTAQVRTPVPAGSVSVVGYAPAVGGNVALAAGLGTVRIVSNSALVFRDGEVGIGAGVGVVLIQGQASVVLSGTVVSVGAGAVTISGSAPSLTQVASAGAGGVTVTGYAPTLSNQIRISTNPGTIRVLNQQIGLSTPEVAPTPSAGVVSIFGNRPGVIATGHWERTAGDAVSWTQTAGASDSWAKVASGSGSWTKI